MKRKQIYLCLAAFALLFGACQSPTPPAPSSPAPTSSSDSSSTATAQEQPEERGILEQIGALYEQLDTSKLPVAQEEWYSLDPKRDMDILPPQLVLDEQQAYLLSNNVRNLLFFGANMLEDFTDIDNAYRPAIILTALYHTPPIRAWNAQGIPEPTDHVVSALIQQETENGRMPSELFYAQDVETTARTLFGDEVDFFHQDVMPYYYFEKAGVYTRPGDFGGPAWLYPQITKYEKTDDGYVCEAVLVWALDQQTPMEAQDGTVITRENFAQTTANNPKYRYTFREEPDGRLVLTALETLRAPDRGRS